MFGELTKQDMYFEHVEMRMPFGQQSRADRREVYHHIWISMERSQLYVNLTVIYLNDFKSMVNTLTHLKM